MCVALHTIKININNFRTSVFTTCCPVINFITLSQTTIIHTCENIHFSSAEYSLLITLLLSLSLSPADCCSVLASRPCSDEDVETRFDPDTMLAFELLLFHLIASRIKICTKNLIQGLALLRVLILIVYALFLELVQASV